MSLDLEINSPEAADITSPEFSFLYNEKYYSTRDMLIERSVSGQRIKLKLKGERKILRAFLRKVKTRAKAKQLVIVTPSKTVNAKDVAPLVVEQVRQALGGDTWIKDSQRSLSETLGLSVRKVERFEVHVSSA